MLVNPANRKLKHAGGIAAALAKRIGPSMKADNMIRTIKLSEGKVVIR